MVKILEQSHQVPLQHGHRHLSHHGHVRDARDLQQQRLVDVLEARDVHHGRSLPHPLRREPIRLGRDAGDYHRRLPHARLHRFVVGALVEPAAAEEVYRFDVHAVHVGAVVREHGGQRPAHDLGPVDDRDGLTLHVPSHRLAPVVAGRNRLQDLHDRKGRAREEALARVVRIVQEADVAVEVGAVRVTEALHVALVADGVAQIIVLTGAAEALDLAEDGVVHDDAVDVRIVVALAERGLDVDGIVEGAELISESVGRQRLAGPFCVLSRGGVVVREQAHEEWSIFRRRDECETVQ
mmetsp:Transcript_49761/g.92086  ORF Transcript_49761/g.92086 Transcript_49761/m.92086 type:complete len:295 (+) Transcript_49761:366-1250(+)